MRIAIEAAAGEGVLAIGAGNYGGKLGKHHFHLRELLR
jgi:formylmethanofuran--tetrahydromethanopterin N-formyltransferase